LIKASLKQLQQVQQLHATFKVLPEMLTVELYPPGIFLQGFEILTSTTTRSRLAAAQQVSVLL
jgi:hypothetical protein